MEIKKAEKMRVLLEKGISSLLKDPSGARFDFATARQVGGRHFPLCLVGRVGVE